ncbi:uncharacterized protein LOC132752756 isoform X4 [Ruditapes philippinarum]|uniref:uncharacterized protein LOC132752756 isoform X4 n=1 Tax=Ruditapes philippinarum TaxID=129788 RepID=UPI00295AF9C6|nr:uncharacterized protein LOC132752756 isoform X4 [Ruditapes philippinarum]
MAGTYYHQEALRKARLIERKTEAMRRLQDSLGDSQEGPGIVESKPSNLVFSEAGHYAQNREFSKYPPEQTNRKKFVRRKKEDVIRKPTPESVKKIPRDQIYGILHPNR